MNDAITVRGANKRYGDFAALDNIDFDVPSGSLTALLGPSGSGKSTLLRAIAGLDQPDTGTVTINGRDVTRRAAATAWHRLRVPALRGVQAPDRARQRRVRPRRSASGRRPRSRRRSTTSSKSSGSAGFQSRYPNQLSGGQRQRMALARALGGRPAGAAARRAVRRARRQGPRGPAGLAAPAARRGTRHHRAGDPRPGRGARRRRPDRGAQQGPHRAGRVARPRSTTPGQRIRDVVPRRGVVAERNLVRPHDIRVGRNPDMAIATGDDTVQTTGVMRRHHRPNRHAGLRGSGGADQRGGQDVRSPRRSPAATPRRSD